MDNAAARSADGLPDRAAITARVLEVARRLLAEIHGTEPADAAVGLDSSFERELRLDSLSRAELLVRLERTFAVDLPEDLLARAESLRDLVAEITAALDTAGGETGKRTRPTASSIATRPAAPFDALDAPRAGTAGRAPVPESIVTLVDAFRWLSNTQPEHEHIRTVAEGAATTITHRALWQAAEAIAGNLQARGFEPGETASIMLATGPAYFQVFLGILLAGGIPVPIYPPTRAAQLVEHVRRHAGILTNARAAVLIADRQTRFAAQLLRAHARTVRFVLSPDELTSRSRTPQPVAIAPDDIAFIQYTSGSTGDPKGVVLTHRNLLANLRAMGTLVQPRPDDVFVSWLPLYHDMGLIGAWFGSMLHAMPLVVMSPLAFLSRPARWLQAMHLHRGTISAAPNFAYELCVRRIDDAELAGVDLSRWRLAFNGAEAVLPQTLRRFAERFAPFGLRREALTPVYGLAESSVGLAFPPLERGPWIDRVDRDLFAHEQRAQPAADDPHALEFVSSGRVLPGHALRVVDEDGVVLPERAEGRIEFRGPSATRGYFHNPAASARLIRDGWLDTGDRGYLAQGELFVTGRVKDIIIRAGRNLYPHEIEAAVGEVEGVRRGCVAAFGRADVVAATERLVVVAETRLTDSPARTRLRAAIGQAVVEAIGEPADEIVLAEPHAVLKTSSGKVRRAATRAALEAGSVHREVAEPSAGAPRSARRAASRATLLGYAARTLLQRWVGAAFDWLYGGYVWAVFVPIAVVCWARVAASSGVESGFAAVRAAMRLLLRLTGMRLHVSGTERLPRGGFVLVANHSSYLDGGVLAAAIDMPLVFVAKREFEARWMPRVFLRALGVQLVERFAAAEGVRDTERLVEVARRGTPLALFPEGTFTRVTTLQPLRLGAFLIAARADLPIVPVAISGTRSILGAHRWLPRRGVIEVTIGEPIPMEREPGDGAKRSVEEFAGSGAPSTDRAAAEFARANTLRRAAQRFFLANESNGRRDR